MTARDTEQWAQRALDALDVGVLVLGAGGRVVHTNALGGSLVPAELPADLADAIEGFIRARRDARRPPPAMRVRIGEDPHFLQVIASGGAPPLEIVFLRKEVMRDIEGFRLLEARHHITRREYQILCALRLGQTNRQIATALGLAPATMGRHVHRLLERFDVPNRTRLVDVVEQLLSRGR